MVFIDISNQKRTHIIVLASENRLVLLQSIEKNVRSVTELLTRQEVQLTTGWQPFPVSTRLEAIHDNTHPQGPQSHSKLRRHWMWAARWVLLRLEPPVLTVMLFTRNCLFEMLTCLHLSNTSMLITQCVRGGAPLMSVYHHGCGSVPVWQLNFVCNITGNWIAVILYKVPDITDHKYRTGSKAICWNPIDGS